MNFYAEESVYPLLHSLVPAALYISLRRLDLALLLVIAWECVERALSHAFSSLVEQPDDSLIGDPLTDAGAILVFWFIDQTTRADDAFRQQVSPWLRLLAFVLIGIASTLLPTLLQTSLAYWGVLLFYAAYVLIGLVVYNRVVFRAGADPAARIAGQSVLVWLWLAGVWTLFALPVTNGSPSAWLSVWARMFYVSLTLNVLALWVYITK